jgi:poly-gamma-glutamate capsule biosynthesis protein CapA/YwtB (metallophosphatase superfamily)
MSWLRQRPSKVGVLLAAAGLAWLAGCLDRPDETPNLVGRPASRPAPGQALQSGSATPIEPPAAPPETARPAVAAPPQTLVVFAGGDVNFGRECGQAILKDPGYDPFAAVASVWAEADLRFANLESQLSDQGGETQSPRHRLIFTGPPGGADVLSRAKIHVVSTANNHAWDYGQKALFETLANLRRAGVAHAGTGETLDAAYRPAVFAIKGWSIAIFAVTHIWNYGHIHEHQGKDHVAWARYDAFKAQFQRARREHDLVLVSYHGGEEYIDAPVTRAREFVKTMMRAGADAFIGHHPHVPQGVGWVKGKPVFYSLGNFVFAGHDDKPWTKVGFLAKLVFSRGNEPGARIDVEAFACPYRLDGHLPKPLSGAGESERARDFQRHLKLISTAVGGSELGDPDELGCFRVSPRETPARLASAGE